MLYILFNFSVDPLQYYRYKDEKNVYWSEQRWQLPGLAKNYKFNTFILGTSMTENFVPSEVDDIFPNAKTIKLSIAGSSIYEQNHVAQIAFKHNKIKNVIWGIDYTALSKEDYVKEEFPSFLYDNNSFNDIKYLLNSTTTKYSFISLLYNISPKLAQISSALVSFNDIPQSDLDSLYYWGDLYTYSKESVIDNYYSRLKDDRNNKNHLINIYNIKKLQRNIDENILPIVQDNPETQFYLYYPPYSILMHKRFYEVDPSLVDNIIQSREYLYSKLSMYPNVKLYDFTVDKEITFNLNNYKDTMHHSPSINKYILKSIDNNRFLLTDENIDKVQQEFKDQLKEYSMDQVN
jgi:hypothetical protein